MHEDQMPVERMKERWALRIWGAGGGSVDLLADTIIPGVLGSPGEEKAEDGELWELEGGISRRRLTSLLATVRFEGSDGHHWWFIATHQIVAIEVILESEMEPPT